MKVRNIILGIATAAIIASPAALFAQAGPGQGPGAGPGGHGGFGRGFDHYHGFGAGPGFGDLEHLLTRRTRLVVVNFPHNPTGYLPGLEEWKAIVDLASQAGVWLFSDEMYRGLEYEEASCLPSGCDLYERAITLATVRSRNSRSWLTSSSVPV